MGVTNQYQNKDAELFAAIRKLQQGDNTDVNKVYELSQRYIYKIINDIVKNHQTTEDLMQETYMQVYNKLNTLQVPETFYVWAGRIATNATLRYIQKNRHEVLAVADENGSTDFVFECARDDSQDAFIPESILQDREAQRLLAEIIDGLSIEQKLSVQYFYYEEMSVSEIAQAMSCSAGTVKSRLNYARKSIKDAVLKLEKQQGTKLYSMAALPLFMLVFQAGKDGLLAGGAAGAAADAAASQVGAGVTQHVGAGAQAAANSATGAGAAAGKSFFAKVLGTTMGKVIAACVTTVVVAGGAIGVTEIVKNVTADKPAQNIGADADYDRHGNGGSGENADIPDSFTEEEWEAWEEGEKVNGSLYIQFGMYKEGDGELGKDLEGCLVGFTTDYQDYSKWEDYGYAISEELLEDVGVQNVVDSLKDLPGYDFLSSLMLQLYKEHGEEYEMSYYETEELAYGENEITKEELLKILKWDKKAPDFLKLGNRHYEITGLTDFAIELDGAENMMMLVLTVNFLEEGENTEELPETDVSEGEYPDIPAPGENPDGEENFVEHSEYGELVDAGCRITYGYNYENIPQAGYLLEYNQIALAFMDKETEDWQEWYFMEVLADTHGEAGSNEFVGHFSGYSKCLNVPELQDAIQPLYALGMDEIPRTQELVAIPLETYTGYFWACDNDGGNFLWIDHEFEGITGEMNLPVTQFDKDGYTYTFVATDLGMTFYADEPQEGYVVKGVEYYLYGDLYRMGIY